MWGLIGEHIGPIFPNPKFAPPWKFPTERQTQGIVQEK
jgi:hypothetical protein